MNQLNSILIEGNLVSDPELSYSTKGTAICKFVVGNNRSWKEDEKVVKEVSFFAIEAFARQAEVCGEFLEKGRGVRVAGRLKQDRWTDADGKNNSRIVIICEHCEFKPQIKAPTAAEEKEPEQPEPEEVEEDT
jgi:single-strand DNA-binding protein